MTSDHHPPQKKKSKILRDMAIRNYKMTIFKLTNKKMIQNLNFVAYG